MGQDMALGGQLSSQPSFQERVVALTFQMRRNLHKVMCLRSLGQRAAGLNSSRGRRTPSWTAACLVLTLEPRARPLSVAEIWERRGTTLHPGDGLSDNPPCTCPQAYGFSEKEP